MPKLPRISGKECIAVLQKMGFVQVRQKGSHVIMRSGERGCVVPMHRELKVGTLAGLLRQGGIDPDDFVSRYKNG
ncbi:MAG TPA: type II toxin-antitoxin system HicA family toxin [Roseimicrobium sp.]|nr:type II toxin-antitoxin system HicA family toxin [Roseimicrobium sp.]